MNETKNNQEGKAVNPYTSVEKTPVHIKALHHIAVNSHHQAVEAYRKHKDERAKNYLESCASGRPLNRHTFRAIEKELTSDYKREMDRHFRRLTPDYLTQAELHIIQQTSRDLLERFRKG